MKVAAWSSNDYNSEINHAILHCSYLFACHNGEAVITPMTNWYLSINEPINGIELSRIQRTSAKDYWQWYDHKGHKPRKKHIAPAGKQFNRGKLHNSGTFDQLDDKLDRKSVV